MENVQNVRNSNWVQMVPLFVIVCIAIFFRFYALNTIPPSPSLDEVSIGYNAYSILKTGEDEYGTKYPLLLRAYDDWRPALYVYTVIPFVALLGLTPLAVRLPSVILSVIVVIVSYCLTQTLFQKRLVSLFVAALLAVSPWHVYISRLGHEANLGLMLIITSFYLFFLSREHASKKWFLTLSAFAFSLSLYSYQSQKIIAPVSVIFLGFLYRKELLRWKRASMVAIFVGVLVSIPIVILTLNPDVSVRFRKNSVFSYHPLYEKTNVLWRDARARGNIISQVVYSPKTTSARIFFANYFLHFQPSWLFWGSDVERHKVSDMGLLYQWEIPFILLGWIALWKTSIDHRIKVFILTWFLSSPLPAALATEAPHAMRSYTFLPMWQIFTALGVWHLYEIFRKKLFKITFIIVIGSLYIWSAFTLYRQYFYEFPIRQSASFEYALPQAIAYAASHETEYQKIIISNQDNLYQSYMYYLFYSQFDPRQYQKLGGTTSGGYDVIHSIDKYEFRPIMWEKEAFDKGILFIGNIKDFPYNVGEQLTVNNLDGKPAIKLISR